MGTGCAVGQTGSPREISDSGATVNGTLLSNTGGQVEYWVQYGLTTAYGSETGHQTVAVQQNVPQPVIAEIAGLARSTTYHYRFCARDSQQTGGPGCGADRTFKTQSFACNEPVTSSLRLTGDVFCENTPAVLVGADGIDVNLAGYSIATPSGVGGGFAAVQNDGHDDVTVRNGSVVGAIRLFDASRNLVRNIDGVGGGDVIFIENGAGNAVRWNTLDARGSGIAATDSVGLIVVGNRATGALGSGIRVEGNGARIAHNEVPATNVTFASGIQLFGSDNRVVSNQVAGPWLAGGIWVQAGANNVIAENNVSDAGNEDPPFDDNFNDGIFVGAFTAGTLLRDNLVQRNTGDGIEVQASNAGLQGNRAFDNGDFGIDAAAGVTDLGGNVASGNGNPLQCRNVFCQ
jgi:parallel beta-helix repeat protein